MPSAFVDTTCSCFYLRSQDKVHNTFCFPKTIGKLEVDVEATNIFFNLTMCVTLINRGVPWRGGQEKDPKSMQVLIEALTTLGVVVSDMVYF